MMEWAFIQQEDIKQGQGRILREAKAGFKKVLCLWKPRLPARSLPELGMNYEIITAIEEVKLSLVPVMDSCDKYKILLSPTCPDI